MRKELWENTELVNKAFPINVFHTSFDETHFLPLHWHEHFELIYIERGEADLHIDGQRWRAVPGDLFFVNSGELHAANEPAQGFVFYAIVFHPSLIGLHAHDFEALELASPYAAGRHKFVNRLERHDEHYPLLRRTVLELIDEFGHKREGYELAVRSFCQLLFTWYRRYYTVERPQESQVAASLRKAERFKELLLHIEQHYAERTTLEQAAAIVHLSPFHFCKMFKKTTGLTFVQFVNRQRVYEAERLLQNSTLSISEIADKVGCGTVNAFSKLYRQYKGCAPSAARMKP